MNMDVKDLIAKLKSGGGKTTAKKGGSSFTAFFDKNPQMKIIILLLNFLINLKAQHLMIRIADLILQIKKFSIQNQILTQQ